MRPTLKAHKRLNWSSYWTWYLQQHHSLVTSSSHWKEYFQSWQHFLRVYLCQGQGFFKCKNIYKTIYSVNIYTIYQVNNYIDLFFSFSFYKKKKNNYLFSFTKQVNSVRIIIKWLNSSFLYNLSFLDKR